MVKAELDWEEAELYSLVKLGQQLMLLAVLVLDRSEFVLRKSIVSVLP